MMPHTHNTPIPILVPTINPALTLMGFCFLAGGPCAPPGPFMADCLRPVSVSNRVGCWLISLKSRSLRTVQPDVQSEA